MYSNKTTYTCDLGYKVNSTVTVKDFSVTCLADGTWEEIVYSCIGESIIYMIRTAFFFCAVVQVM